MVKTMGISLLFLFSTCLLANDKQNNEETYQHAYFSYVISRIECAEQSTDTLFQTKKSDHQTSMYKLIYPERTFCELLQILQTRQKRELHQKQSAQSFKKRKIDFKFE